MADRRSGSIPEPRPSSIDKLPLKFSFKHLDFENLKFRPSVCTLEYLLALLEALQRFSTWTVDQFMDINDKENRHSIYFPETSEPDGFEGIPPGDVEQFGYHDGWQFRIYSPQQPWQQWRVHGILIDDTFFVVWLDERHLLYNVR
jgi:hypothetical protein